MQSSGRTTGRSCVGHRHRAAVGAVDDRDRRSPVTLAGDAPVAQSERRLLLAQPQPPEVGGDGLDGVGVRETVVPAGIDAAAACLVFVPRLPVVRGERPTDRVSFRGRIPAARGPCYPLHFDYLPDGEPVLFREREVALVVRRDAHHRAVAVAHQHVVADPDLDRGAGQRMADDEPRRHPLLLHRREVGFHHRAVAALVDECRQRRIGPRGVQRQRMLGGDGAERDTHDGVGARREDVHPAVADRRAGGVADVVREREAHAHALADPVRLHRPHALRPAGHLVQLAEELVRVVGDLEVVAGDLALFDHGAGAPAAAVDHLLVGEHRLVDRIPVDDLRLAVGDALVEHPQEQPLVPPVVGGIAGGDLARPVDREPHRLHLLLHVGDVVVGPARGRDAVLHRGILGRQPEGIPAHRHQHVPALHPQVPVHHVVDRVVAHVSHVQLARRVREHRDAVVLAAGEARIVLAGAVDVARIPAVARGGFDCGGIERLHGREGPDAGRRVAGRRSLNG